MCIIFYGELYTSMKKKSFKELTKEEILHIQDLNYNQKQTIVNISKMLHVSESAIKQVLNEFPEKIYFKVKPINVDVLLEKIPKDIFVSYYSSHSKKETISSFNITEQEFKILLKTYNFKKDKDAIYEVRKKTNLEKYGVDNLFKDTEKIKKAMLNKYGVEYNSQIEGFKEKRNNTIVQKYGSKETFEETQLKKREQTNLNKYGYKIKLADPTIVKQVRESQYQKYGSKENFFQHIREKQQSTIIEKYGSKEKYVNHIKKKQVESLIKKYGDIESANRFITKISSQQYFQKTGYLSSFQDPKIIAKCKETTLQKYGVDNIFKSTEWQNYIHKKKKETIKNQIVANKGEHYYDLYHNKNYVINVLDKYSTPPSIRQFAADNNIPYYTAQIIILKFGLQTYFKHEKSHFEDDISAFISSLCPSTTILRNTKSILSNGKELDIYLPEYKLAIEFNGTYWHSTLNLQDKNYHLNKSKECESLGIHLVHIYQYEWEDGHKRELIKTMLRLFLGKIENKIYARECKIKQITNKEAKPFNEANHLQGHRNAQVTYGLFYKGELVQLMSFSKTKYNRNLKNDDEWEIIRGCPGSLNLVIGGVSKLLSHFIKNYKPSKIFSYCDFNKFIGTSYEKCGMNFIGYTGADKHYIINGVVVNRSPKNYRENNSKKDALLWGAGSKKYEMSLGETNIN